MRNTGNRRSITSEKQTFARLIRSLGICSLCGSPAPQRIPITDFQRENSCEIDGRLRVKPSSQMRGNNDKTEKKREAGALSQLNFRVAQSRLSLRERTPLSRSERRR